MNYPATELQGIKLPNDVIPVETGNPGFPIGVGNDRQRSPFFVFTKKTGGQGVNN